MNYINIAIGCDHAGFELKLVIKDYLLSLGMQVIDFGTNSKDSVDYADYAHLLARSIQNGECDMGIAICGSGNGINMSVNKHVGIRGALCWIPEIARLARSHNNANVCSLPGRFITAEEGKLIVEQFLTTPFEGGRHELRIKKIDSPKQTC